MSGNPKHQDGECQNCGCKKNQMPEIAINLSPTNDDGAYKTVIKIGNQRITIENEGHDEAKEDEQGEKEDEQGKVVDKDGSDNQEEDDEYDDWNPKITEEMREETREKWRKYLEDPDRIWHENVLTARRNAALRRREYEQMKLEFEN